MKRVYLSVRLKNYENALSLVGARCVETPWEADLLLLPGGGDVHPRFYGQQINGSTDIDEARDGRELALVDEFLRAGKPIVGICRGLQLLNVYFGGTLRQHIEGHSQIDGVDRLHAINTAPGLLRALYGARFTVNSAHHQAVETLGEGLQVLACAPDGTAEAIAHKALPVFAVQWHPERLCGAFSRPETVDGAALLSALLR
jgi:putative glutamine amidotransferase